MKTRFAYTPIDTAEGETFAGGIPYLLPSEKWPLDTSGNPYVFLFQCELANVPDSVRDDVMLPPDGLLQFFHKNDPMFGMDGDVLVRHVVGAVDKDIPNDRTVCSPLQHPLSRTYYVGENVISLPCPESLEFDEDPTDSEREYFDFYLGGYPEFTQNDFRDSLDECSLILGSVSDDRISWGDLGCAGFWLPKGSTTLSDSFVYWDCF